jgi:hypothetical protein
MRVTVGKIDQPGFLDMTGTFVSTMTSSEAKAAQICSPVFRVLGFSVRFRLMTSRPARRGYSAVGVGPWISHWRNGAAGLCLSRNLSLA